MNKVLYFLADLKEKKKSFSIAGGGRLASLYKSGMKYMDKGKYDDAIVCFQKGYDEIREKDDSTAFKLHQLWQYRLEQARFMAGKPDVEDPFFHCKSEPVGRYDGKEGGRFSLTWTHKGLNLSGVSGIKAKSVRVFIDNVMIREFRIRKGRFLPGSFRFLMSRPLVGIFPTECTLTLSLSTGEILTYRKSDSVHLTVPHGTGELFAKLDSGIKVNKKGMLTASEEDIKKRQERYLELYRWANSFFQEKLGKPLFILYGTLLGFYRGGDYIPGDDDFDAGYFSLKNSAAEVKTELKKLVVEMVLEGAYCNVNRKGKLFRFRLSEDDPSVHLDLRPVWFEEGSIWLHKQACLPLKPEDFLPVQNGTLRSVEIMYPANPEAFLEAYYGKGWKVPDPSYTNSSVSIPDSVIEKLRSICISPEEFSDMSAEIDARRKDYPGAGKLVSMGSQSLYPLDEYEALCGW